MIKRLAVVVVSVGLATSCSGSHTTGPGSTAPGSSRAVTTATIGTAATDMASRVVPSIPGYTDATAAAGGGPMRAPAGASSELTRGFVAGYERDFANGPAKAIIAVIEYRTTAEARTSVVAAIKEFVAQTPAAPLLPLSGIPGGIVTRAIDSTGTIRQAFLASGRYVTQIAFIEPTGSSTDDSATLDRTARAQFDRLA